MKVVSITLAGADNPGAMLGEALSSVAHFVDECIVVDNGISDNSIEHARAAIQFPATPPALRVVPFAWTACDAGRNAALDAAKDAGADWAVIVDSDEFIVPPQFVRRDLESATVDYFMAPHVTLGYEKIRYVRIPARGRYVDAVHEQFVPEGAFVHAVLGAFDEREKSPEKLRARCARDVDVLLTLDPTPNRLWHLGTSYEVLGELERAVEAWRKAVVLLAPDAATPWGAASLATIRAKIAQHAA
jgi:glycosyltransferase involved in cell wall biosynthesis